MLNIYVRIIKSQLNDVKYNGKYSDNANPIVYVLLDISMWLSHESKTCDFTGICSCFCRLALPSKQLPVQN